MSHHILIVDDSTTARMLIQRCIEIAGWQDVTFANAANGREALNTLGETIVDLVVTDMNMPEMDGEELLLEIRKQPNFASLPVIVITSLGNEAREKSLREAGADAVLPKPVSPPLMAETLQKLFGETDAE